MKKINILFLLAAILMALPSCEQYDEIAMWNKNESMDARLQELEELCDRMNTNIASLQVIVDALQENDYVTSVTPVVEAGDTIGYTLNFSQSGPTTIYHGENGADGADGNTPSISARRDTDGIYYWTIDGDWMRDEKGNKVRAQGPQGATGRPGQDGDDGTDGDDGAPGKDGVTPKLRIGEDGYWYVSYDKGATWEKLGIATGTPGTSGDSMFESVTVNEDHIVLVLAENGSEIKLPLYEAGFSFEIDQSTVTCAAGGSAEVGYTLTPDDATIQIESVSHSPYQVTIDRTAKKIRITLPAGETPSEESEILLFASDDKTTLMRKITVKTLQLNYFRYKAKKQLSSSWSDRSGYTEHDCFFDGIDVKRLYEYDTYDSSTGEGAWAYTGTVTWIYASSMIESTDLLEITIPASITDLGYEGTGFAFSKCTSLRKVTFEEGNLTTLIKNTFEYCTALETVTLPSSLITIGNNVFKYCSALTEIVIPDKVTTIGEGAFTACTSLKHVTLGSGVSTIEKKAFAKCYALKWVLCDIETPPTIDQGGNTTASFPKPEDRLDPPYYAEYKIYVPKDQLNTYRTEWKSYWAEGFTPTKVIYPIPEEWPPQEP